MIIQQKRIFSGGFLLLLLFLTVAAWGILCPLYAGGPYKGMVIDTETKQAIEGAVVLAVWDKDYLGPAGRVSYFLDTEEVLTDVNGRFVIGTHPPRTFSLALVSGPRLLIYRPGYGFFPDYGVNPKIKISSKELLRMMETEGVTIELTQLTREERLYTVRKMSGETLSVPENKKPILLQLRSLERKALGLSVEDGQINSESLITGPAFPDKKKLDLLHQQYRHILIHKNGRYFNTDGTPSGKLFEKDLPDWAREMLWQLKYVFNLWPLISERPDILEESDYLPFCIKGRGSLIRTPDPVAKMQEFLDSKDWKSIPRNLSDDHGSSKLVYEKEERLCLITVEMDEAGTVPRRYGFEIRCKIKGAQKLDRLKETGKTPPGPVTGPAGKSIPNPMEISERTISK
jgi:hypothetical protein